MSRQYWCQAVTALANVMIRVVVMVMVLMIVTMQDRFYTSLLYIVDCVVLYCIIFHYVVHGTAWHGMVRCDIACSGIIYIIVVQYRTAQHTAA